MMMIIIIGELTSLEAAQTEPIPREEIGFPIIFGHVADFSRSRCTSFSSLRVRVYLALDDGGFFVDTHLGDRSVLRSPNTQDREPKGVLIVK
jgi:hypothetical protein